AASACLRLQPGADGLRGDDLRGPQAEVPRLPDDEELPRLSHGARRQIGELMSADGSTIVVVAAVIDAGGRFLVTRRPSGVHLEGVWEFPGGKCDPGEPLHDALARELREELGVSSRAGDEIFSTTHAYPDRTIELHFFRC